MLKDKRSAEIEQVLAKYPPERKRSAVMPLLDLAQRQEGWVTKPAIDVIAQMLNMASIRVLEVATFYTMFELHPVGKHHIQVCTNLPCQLRGSDAVVHACKEKLGIGLGERTADGKFSWEEVECLGACDIAPMASVDGVFIGPGAILTNDHNPRAINYGGEAKSPNDWEKVGVNVLEGASIGAGAICIAPITIGKWSLVGAGAVVTKDVPDNVMVAGVPATVKKELSELVL